MKIYPVVTFLVVALLNSGSLTLFAQSTKDEKARIKNFGKSLKKDSAKSKSQTAAENTSSPGNEEPIRISTELIVNDIAVLDKQGNSVTGLKQEDFTVTEDELKQEIESFSPGTDESVPRTLVLVISHALAYPPYGQKSVTAAKVLVDQLKPNDKMAIVTDEIRLLVDFTGDRDLLKSKIDSIYQDVTKGKHGFGLHYHALLASVNELFKKEDVRPIVIFQTDGGLLAFRMTGSPYLKPASPDYLLESVKKSRAVIYTIVPGFNYLEVPEAEQIRRAKIDYRNQVEVAHIIIGGIRPELDEPPIDDLIGFINSTSTTQSLLTQIADISGGSVEFFQSPEQIAKVYSGIMAETQRRYVIGYYSNNQTAANKIRNIKIEVRNHPEYTIQGRKAYYAP